MKPDIANEVRQFLSGFDSALAVDLTRVVLKPPPTGASMLDFEINFDSRAFRVVGFNMDRSASQHGDNHYLLRGADRSWPEPIANAIENDDENLAIDSTVLNELVAWFAMHWTAAGGAGLAIPAYACRHDDLRSYDLTAGTWIEDTKKWN